MPGLAEVRKDIFRLPYTPFVFRSAAP